MTVWTDDMDAMLERGVSDGLSFAQIAAPLGVSRNAAIGRAHRKGWKSPNAVGDPRGRSAAGFAHAHPQGNTRRNNNPLGNNGGIGKRIKERETPHLPPAPWKPRKIEDMEVPVSLGVSLLDLTDRMCKWPHGEGTPYLFCGQKPFGALVYCEYHSRLAYQPSADTRARQRQAERAMGAA